MHARLPPLALPLSMLGAVSVLPVPAPAAAQASADARALRAESLMVEAMGGREAWHGARFLDFVWAIERGGRTVERRHVWDRRTGRYKLEAPLGEAGRMAAVFNTYTREGRVWVNGEELPPDSAATLLQRAYAIHINDAYWFIMPFKWRDEGVHLRHEGFVTDGAGKRWEVVQLTFENVGLTPDNRYLCYLDPETHVMGWWEHFRHHADSAPALAARWSAWEWRGPIRVSLDRPFIGGDARIFFPRAVIAAEVPEDAFAVGR